MRALIVDMPWIELILSGRKPWEMRTRSMRIRGTVGLIRKGSGTVVGVAEATDCLPPLTPDDYARHEDMHRIPPERQQAAIAGGWLVPWVLGNVRRLEQPVPYRHMQGAVVWVSLDDETSRFVTAASGGEENHNSLRV